MSIGSPLYFSAMTAHHTNLETLIKMQITEYTKSEAGAEHLYFSSAL